MDEKTLDAIHRLLVEIAQTKGELKTLRDGLADELEQNDEYKEVAEEAKDLANKRREVKKSLQADKAYQKLSSEVEELRFKLKDLQEILSHHLVTYYSESGSTEITDSNGESHQVIISAKIGKEQ